MTELTVNKTRRTRAATNQLFLIDDGIQLFGGGFYGFNWATGEVVIWTDAVDVYPLGILLGDDILGDGTLKAAFDNGPYVIENIDVTGATAITDVGAAFYNTTADDDLLTLTAPAVGPPVRLGIIIGFNSATSYDVLIDPVHERLPGVQLQNYVLTNVTTDRTMDANAAADAEIADVLATLIIDLAAQGFLTV